MIAGMRHKRVLDVSGDPILTDVRQPGSEGDSAAYRSVAQAPPIIAAYADRVQETNRAKPM